MGVDGLLLNTHYDPTNSENDTKTHIPLQKVRLFLNKLKRIGLENKKL